MTEERVLNIHDLSPGIRASGATTQIYFDPTKFEVYAFSTIGSGTPMMAFNRRHLYLGKIPNDAVNGEVVESYVEGLSAELGSIADGYEEEWDGSNHKGKLTLAAQGVLERIQENWSEAVEDIPSFWDAGEWFSPVQNETTREILDSSSVREWALEAVKIALVDGGHLDEDDVIYVGRDYLEKFVDRNEDEEDDEEIIADVAKARKLYSESE